MGRDLQRRAAIVTESRRGIGLGIAKKLSEKGTSIVTSGVNKDNAEDGMAEIEAMGGKAVYILTDVSKYEDAQGLVDTTVKEMGNLDILVDNTGINEGRMLHKMSADDWNAVVAVNLTEVFNCVRAVVNYMREREYGRTIDISSASYLDGNIGQVNYAAAKAGVVALTKTCAKENEKKNITCNVIVPRFIDTEMTRGVPKKAWDIIVGEIPIGRADTSEDIRSMIALLASDETSYITQGVFEVDGGMAL